MILQNSYRTSISHCPSCNHHDHQTSADNIWAAGEMEGFVR